MNGLELGKSFVEAYLIFISHYDQARMEISVVLFRNAWRIFELNNDMVVSDSLNSETLSQHVHLI